MATNLENLNKVSILVWKICLSFQKSCLVGLPIQSPSLSSLRMRLDSSLDEVRSYIIHTYN